MEMKGELCLPELSTEDFGAYWTEDMSSEEYHKQCKFVSSTGVREILRSELHFYERMGRGNAPSATPAMKKGSLIHSAVLEPARFAKNMTISPSFDARTIVGKANKEKFMKDLSPDAIVVTEEEHDMVMRILDSVFKHQVAAGILVSGVKEVSGFFKDPETNVLCRIRPDLLLAEDNMIFDLKTTTDASKDRFMKSIVDYGYHIAAAFYLHGASIIEQRTFDRFQWIAVETSPPYAVALYEADMAWIGMGEVDFKKALKRLKTSIETKQWPGYQTESEFISPPNWLIQKRQYEDELLA